MLLFLFLSSRRPWVPPVVPEGRRLLVDVEDRVLLVAREERTAYIQPEDRTLKVRPAAD